MANNLISFESSWKKAAEREQKREARKDILAKVFSLGCHNICVYVDAFYVISLIIAHILRFNDD